MNYRKCLLGLALAGVLAPTAQAGGDDGETLRFQVAAHVQAHADPQQDGSIAVQLSPSGKRQTLVSAADADGNSRWSLEDVDFDGYPELVARAPVGMVNEAVAVYRFDPAVEAFRVLQAETHGKDSCGELMGLTVDRPSRTLTSSCRSGPMWYTDQYRFAGATLHLYRAERVLMLGDTLNAALQWNQTDEQGPLAVWRTYDAMRPHAGKCHRRWPGCSAGWTVAWSAGRGGARAPVPVRPTRRIQHQALPGPGRPRGAAG